jgi:RNA polymerase sigma-70 factor (ECF subfamily)
MSAPAAPSFDALLSAARPKAVAALLRYFRDLDTAEDAFQEASLRALKAWPRNGPPRDAAAWLIFVGRNIGIDAARRRKRQAPLPDEAVLSDLDDAEHVAAEKLDDGDYRDDILRLLFVCCHPDLPAAHQVALALRIVCGVPMPRIARAFLASEPAMEQRLTRAKAKIAAAGLAFEAPDALERTERLATVMSMVYLVFNEGYTQREAASPGDRRAAASLFCEEAIRLARLLLRLYPADPELMGLTALMLLQHARAEARLDATGAPVLLEDQDRSLWNRDLIGEGLALLDKAVRHASPGPYQLQAAIAALHARAKTPAETDWRGIERLYRTLERLDPSPVVTLNRAVAVWKCEGAAAALDLVEPLGGTLSGYFYFHGLRGGLLSELGRAREAREAFNRAIALAQSPADAAHIRAHLDKLQDAPATIG